MTPAQTALVEQHVGFAEALTRRRTGRRYQFDDLVGYAYIGLCEAALAYREQQGAFTNFAYHRISGAIIDGIRKEQWAPRRVPAEKRAWVSSLEDTVAEDQRIGDLIVSIDDPAQQAVDRITLAEIDALGDRERECVLYATWGVHWSTIAARYDVTESRVCQIRRRALARLT